MGAARRAARPPADRRSRRPGPCPGGRHRVPLMKLFSARRRGRYTPSARATNPDPPAFARKVGGAPRPDPAPAQAPHRDQRGENEICEQGIHDSKLGANPHPRKYLPIFVPSG